ncbi:MAG: hypothetical protein PHR24_05280 [Oscillospiraceae bacterium]|nr:hypothetical protein [Oscillospiraceae bacterium]
MNEAQQVNPPYQAATPAEGMAPAGQVDNAPPAGQVDNAPPVGQVDNAPPVGQVDNAPPVGQVDNAPPAGQVDNAPPAGQVDNVSPDSAAQENHQASPEPPLNPTTPPAPPAPPVTYTPTNYQVSPGQPTNQIPPSAPPGPPPQFGQYYSTPIHYSPGQPAGDYSFAPVQNGGGFMAIRELMGSNLMLALVILYLSSIVLSVISAMIGSAGASQIFNQLDFLDYDIGSFNYLFSFIGGIIGSIPSILILIGFFVSYRSANSINKIMTPSGFSIIRVVTIIQFVFACIMILLIFIAGLLIASGTLDNYIYEFFNELLNTFGESGEFPYSDSFNEFNFISLLGPTIILITVMLGTIMVFAYIVILKFLGSIINTIRTGVPYSKGATAFYVISFVLGGFSAFGLLGSLKNIVSNPTYGLLQFVTSAIQVSLYFVAGALAYKYRKMAR